MGKDEKLPEYGYSKVPTQQVIAEKQEIPSHYGYGVRHIQLLICFLCLMVNFIGRGHMGVTVVSMSSPAKHNTVLDTNPTEQTNNTNIQDIAVENMTIEDISGKFAGNKSIDGVALVNSTENIRKTYDWPKSTQEMVLGAFFLGYCIMTLPMGLVAQRWGGKIPLQIALFVNGIVSILTPWLINWGGWKAVCACRIAQGLSQAGVFPSVQTLLANWVPVNERGTLASYVYTGSTTGTVVAFQLSGYLSESRWGWPSTFWAVGLICLGLFAILTIFGAATPSDHKTICEEEKSYIMGRLDTGKVERLKTPWKAIICSRPMCGILATHIGSGTAFVFFFTQVPSYIHYILGVNVRGSGFLSSLPYVISFFTSISFGMLSDFLTNKKIVTIKNARRIFNSIFSGWGYRHQQCFILFCTLTTAYSMRSCMGVSLVAMTYHARQGNESNVNVTEFKIEGIMNALMLVPPYPVFNWTKKVQDIVIASFFWGYMLLQIPAGQLAHRFGTRYLLSGAMMINCLVSIFFPNAAYYGGWIFPAICRMVQGLSQACILPGLHTALGKWAPLHERGRMSAYVYGGQALGTVLGLPMSGFIAASPMGWPGIFRFYGFLSGLLGVVIWFMAADAPAQHPKISDGERKYIEVELGNGVKTKRMSVPWGKILRHRGMYAIIISHIGQTWGQLTLYSEVPAFMDKIMGVNIKANGLLTALPFLVMWFTNFFFSWMTDILIMKKILSVTNTRKFANSLGNVPAAIGLVALAFAPRNIYVVETILVIICGFKISTHLGFHINHIDISPNFAGTMMSISNFVSNFAGSMSPMVVGFILTDVSDPFLWRQIFFVAAGMYFFTNLVYVILGTAVKAEWNDPPQEETADEESQPMMEKPKV